MKSIRHQIFEFIAKNTEATVNEIVEAIGIDTHRVKDNCSACKKKAC